MGEPLVTVGVISEKTGISVFTVQYILNSRHIEPIQRAGRLRVFDEGVIEQVRNEHQKMRRGVIA